MTSLARRSALLAVCAVLAVTQVWFWLRVYLEHGVLAHSDLYEQFLPVFLSQSATWSSTEFAGLPIFADPQGAAWYPLHWVFTHLGHAWSSYIVSAYVVGSTGAALYAWHISRSYAAALVAGLAWPWSEAMADLFPHLAMLHGFAWLPWVLYGLEQTVGTGSRRWCAVTAIAFACLALSGHPQVSVYGAYLVAAYGLVLWLRESRRREVLLLVLGAFVLGGALAAIQIVPTAEAASWIARDKVNFSAFADSFAKKPHELLTAFIPQFCHERREAPTYVGLITLWCAGLALLAAPRAWRTWFWTAVAVIGLLLGLGSLTPLATVAYELPFYDKFRVVARHLALYSFAIIALAALAIGALQQGRIRARRVLVSLGVLTLLTGAALSFTAARPDLFDFSCNGHGFGRLLPVRLEDPWLQAAVALLGAVTIVLAGGPRTRRVGLALLPVVVALDLLNAQSEPVDLRGFEPPTIIDRSLLEPSVHVARLGALARPGHQRLLPIEGSAVDPLLPGAFARLWQIPSLGGYNPLLPSRLTRLAQMDANGAVRARLMMPEDQTTDLFGVRFAIARDSVLTWPVPVPADTPAARLPELDLEAGPSDCRPRGPLQMTLALPPGVEMAGIAVDWELVCEDNIKSDRTVGRLDIPGAAPVALLARPGENRDGIRPVHEDQDREALAMGSLTYRLPQAIHADRLVLQLEGMEAWVLLRHAAVVGTDGRLHPLALPQAAFGVRDRWEEVSRFSTSRDTDRGRDEDGRDETPLVVFENLRARPRAWWVGHAAAVADDYAAEAIRLGRLRDGTPWDVSRTALMLPEDNPGALAQGPPESGAVEMRTVTDGHFELASTAPRAGIVVVAELHHPGWRAFVDGQPAALLRVDHAIMGVRVPAGPHTVTLTFAPPSFMLGAGISLLAVLVTLWFLVSRHRSGAGLAGPARDPALAL